MIEHGEVFLIGTDDGTMFRCFTRPVGPDQTSRWVFQSAEYEYTGPDAAIANSPAELEPVVQQWWRGRKDAFPHA